MRWLDNVTAMLNREKIPLGEFEKRIGKAPGYLSRYRKKTDIGDDAYPTGDILLRIANELNISIESLLTDDLSEEQSNLHTLKDFIRKLRVDTINRKIVWDSFTKEDLVKRGDTFTGYLFKRELIRDETPPYTSPEFDCDKDYKVWSEDCTFTSRFNKEAVVTDNSFEGSYGDELRIYLIRVGVDRNEGWEMYMEDISRYDEFSGYASIFEPMFSTLSKPADDLEPDVNILLQAIRENLKDAYIGVGLRAMINHYMNM